MRAVQVVELLMTTSGGSHASRCPTRLVLAAACARFAGRRLPCAQAPEKTKLTIGVGGKTLFYYLPLTIAERNGYFKAEGLDVEILDFAGGAQALQALVGGSADVVSGAYEHTITSRPRARSSRRSCCRASTRASCSACQGEGRGVQVAGRSEGHEDRRHRAGLVDQHVRQHPAREGGPEARCDVAIIGVGATAGAVAIMKRGEIDAHLQPRPGDHAARVRRRRSCR